MNLADGVQVVGTVVSLVGVGFALGTAYAARRRSHRSLQSALERVRSALSNIEVNSIRVAPAMARLGAQVVIDFEMTSKLSAPLEVWLGADIVYGPDQYFYDVTQDKVVALEPGQRIYSRYLTLAAPLTSGSWTINAGVWVGKKSDPDHSIRLVLRSVEIAVR
jgi:hypothetical protein